MSELLKAFDSYNVLERNFYFTLSYNTLASELRFMAPLTCNKKNMDKVLEVLDLEASGYQLLFKHWDTDDSSDHDPNKDFTTRLLFKSQHQNSLVSTSLDDDTILVDFYYDCTDSKLEEWVFLKNNALRKQFGLSQKPTFKVLTNSKSEFDTEYVRTEPIAINLQQHYNDDFVEVYNRIDKAIDKKQSGLILLYGKPGTGKTTFIKSLISDHKDSNFIFVQNEFVHNLLDPEFISFLLKQRNSILIIEDAEKVIKSREQVNQDSVVSTILQLTDGLFSDYLNIKVICTFNSNLSKVDTALLRKGRMIAKYEFKALALDKTNAILKELNLEPSKEELVVADIFNRNQKSYSNIEKGKIGF